MTYPKVAHQQVTRPEPGNHPINTIPSIHQSETIS
jgi:hypothetical protein